MADSSTQATAAQSEMATAEALPFRFEVTWRSLTQGLEPGLAAPTVALAPALRPPPAAKDAEAKEWEMVLPRMPRRAGPEAESPAPDVPAPTFAAADSSAPRHRLLLIAGAPLLAAVCAAGFFWSGNSAPASRPAAVTMEMGSAGWITEWASDRIGSARGRQISLYRPSMKMSDYRLEFTGRIERRSVAWVFRVVDSRNYYVGKLEAATPASPLAIAHFAVINGVEGPHVQRVLAHPGAEPWKIRLEARGPRFTVYLQDQVIEDWQDDRLKFGGVGFLNERDERGQVGSIRISFPGGASR